MQLYAIIGRDGFADEPDLQAAAARSTRVGDEEMPDDIRWIRSYVLNEASGRVGTLCIYEASSPGRSASTRPARRCRSMRSWRSPIRSSCGPTRRRNPPEH
jgi:hypothetical protein